MMKCKVCGKRFALLKENKYIVTDICGIMDGFIGGAEKYECFDCTFCGCQNVIQSYKEPEIKEPEIYWQFKKKEANEPTANSKEE